MESGCMNGHTSKIDTQTTDEGNWVSGIIVLRGERKLVVSIHMRGGGEGECLEMEVGFCLERR